MASISLLSDGRVIGNGQVTIASTPLRVMPFCADTLSKNPLQKKVHRVSLLYHETTYLKEAEERAFSRHHSTTEQAAAIARLANAGAY